jgi:plasmid replication initiation protein
MSSMEHPVFSLSTKPDMRPRHYERGGNWIEISPSRYGLATVHDRDVLIYCISQCMSALNEGRKVARTMRFKGHDLLVATNRQTSGRGYELLKDALRRLQVRIPASVFAEFSETAGREFGFTHGAKKQLFLKMWKAYKTRSK